eukprot:TRINITY_DN90766_c0_g1_i1.p1 TRINITY_DN90766_c0_g1~~TRINITY_DN90766_c0_g1_i1.p1  ORF type:complete len:237 (+),score=36.15 TRINITY_DN90766_c0_g1_i1:85-795(+)
MMTLNSSIADEEAIALYGCKVRVKNTFIECEYQEMLEPKVCRSKSDPDLGLPRSCSYTDRGLNACSTLKPATSLSSRSLDKGCMVDNRQPSNLAGHESSNMPVLPVNLKQGWMTTICRKTSSTSLPPDYDDLDVLADSRSSAASEKQTLGNNKQEDAENLSGEMKKKMHETGACVPCTYFRMKADGCRLGNSCDFCHFCSEQKVKQFWRTHKKVTRLEKSAALGRVQRGRPLQAWN